jgi:hypothetical protein
VNATKDRLMAALVDAGAPVHMLERCARGGYDDFLCEESGTPMLDLIRDCTNVGLANLALRVTDGEFDATPQEAEEWFAQKGRRLLSGEAKA